MNFQLIELRVDFRRTSEVIPFAQFSYFYGQMGAGKSSIARLIDYCLGGDLDYTPALQAEFVAATLLVHIEGKPLMIVRERDSNQVRAQWDYQGFFDLVLPARVAKGEVLPDTDVEVLSDLLFYLAGYRPPRVRRSKMNETSELARLSFRDLWWYCFLDQEEIDSNFFHLDRSANNFKRLKSRDVLRFVLGYHQEKVAELEALVEQLYLRRLTVLESANALKRALSNADIGSLEQIEERRQQLQHGLADVVREIEALRQRLADKRGHAADTLRERSKSISYEVAALETALSDLDDVISDEQRHLYELKTLSVKAYRDAAARAVLSGVEFDACPRCAQSLPTRTEGECRVCGQSEIMIQQGGVDADTITEDVRARQQELSDLLEQHQTQRKGIRSRLEAFRELKVQVDTELNNALRDYDSAYLSSALELEHRRATFQQRILESDRLAQLPRAVEAQLSQADHLAVQEEEARRHLSDARKEAEKDTKNLRLLETLFLDCLVRAHVPGFTTQDQVAVTAPWFLPEVQDQRAGDVIVNSFANLGSGGKKTLFKACFAIALHRLAAQTNALLPTVLIIDSPMKNISERENRLQFEGFHALLYELATDELAQTQFILIDKEYLPAPEDFPGTTYVRHMIPHDSVGSNSLDLPLIPYFGISTDSGQGEAVAEQDV